MGAGNELNLATPFWPENAEEQQQNTTLYRDRMIIIISHPKVENARFCRPSTFTEPTKRGTPRTHHNYIIKGVEETKMKI